MLLRVLGANLLGNILPAKRFIRTDENEVLVKHLEQVKNLDSRLNGTY